MPLTALIIFTTETATDGYLLFSLFKQAINAVFYTAIASIVIFMFDEKLTQRFKSQQPASIKNLKQYLHYILWIMSAFCVIAVCLFLSRSVNNIQHQQINDKLDLSSLYLSRIVETYVVAHQKAIIQTANKLSAINSNENSAELAKSHLLFPGFISMLITDDKANLIATSPRSRLEKVTTGTVNVSDRSYFSEAFFNERPHTSSVFLGRGFGSDPIVAISAPIYQNNNDTPSGVVEGSLNLNMFNKVNNDIVNNNINVLLTDENNNIIYADKALNLVTLSKFSFTEKAQQTYKLMIVEAEDPVRNDVKYQKYYLYRHEQLNNGWKIFVLLDHSQLLDVVEQQYLMIFMSLFLIFIFVILLARQFATTLNRPLEFALRELAHGDGKNGYKPIPYEAPAEFFTLYNQLQHAKMRLLKNKFSLQETVEKRTLELNLANQALKELANKDSLTGLYNRRYLEKKFNELQAILSRNKVSMIVAMIDLDHFKQLNDNHGHLVGDNCLEFVAKLMKSKFDRRSDIVARFGGEEFIIVAQHDKNYGVLQKLEELRQEISEHRFSFDNKDSFQITVSIGVAIANASYSAKIENWISIADKQLYWVKDNGRNSISEADLQLS
jgi:diguanylate cyclase (GGDEF)-like protein